MFSIRQTATGWQVLNAAGEQIGEDHGGYDFALMAISGLLAAQQLAAATAATDGGDEGATSPDGLLPETWTSTTGVAFQERLVGGRDFTGCVWTWRDPSVYPLPLMHQTDTDVGHFGATTAGYADTWELRDGTVYPSGRFYDSEAGRTLRDQMLAARVGVSVDPTEDVDVEFHCTEYDDDGWCMDGDDVFLAYEIAGLTATPFPGFPNATIELGAASAAAPAMAAAGSRATQFTPPPMYPPRPWMTMPEPELGSELLVVQDDGGLACPLTITDEGQVFGHVARDGQCHSGYLEECQIPPSSGRALSLSTWRATPIVCDDGTEVIGGPLIAGMDHPDLYDEFNRLVPCATALAAYADSGSIWAQVTMTNGEFGTWFAGALMPNVTELQRRVLRGCQVSGDWREPRGAPIDLIAALAVPIAGFGITRQAIAASGLVASGATIADRPLTPRVAYKGAPGQATRRVVAMTSVRMVARCPECQRRSLAAGRGMRPRDGGDETTRELLDLMRKVERRTRAMLPAAVTAAAARVPRG